MFKFPSFVFLGLFSFHFLQILLNLGLFILLPLVNVFHFSRDSASCVQGFVSIENEILDSEVCPEAMIL